MLYAEVEEKELAQTYIKWFSISINVQKEIEINGEKILKGIECKKKAE